MTPARPTRRGLVLGGASLGAALLVRWQSSLAATALPAKLLRRLGDDARLRAPGATGAVDGEILGLLWRLAARIVERWELAGHAELDEGALAAFVREKTARPPSYLVEYRAAGHILAAAERDAAADPAAYDRVFARPSGLLGYETTALGRMQKFVVAEFIELAVASGGFRAFGWRNYRGFAGGPLADAARPPYRTP